MRTRVLVATPIKGNIPPSYLNGIVGMLQYLDDADYVPCVCAASYINVGRNDLV